MAQIDTINKENLNENEVINKILEGEQSLFETIIRKYNPYLYKIGRSYNYSHEDTQDLMQDTFVAVYKNLSSFEQRSSLKTWIVRIMLNNCYQRKMKASFKNEFAQELKENAMPMFSEHNNDTELKVEKNEMAGIIERALIKIPYDYRMTFSLREINGMSVHETAEIMNVSESNVKVRLNRAKKMLREIIAKSYKNTEIFEFNLIYCDAIVENVMKRISNI